MSNWREALADALMDRDFITWDLPRLDAMLDRIIVSLDKAGFVLQRN